MKTDKNNCSISVFSDFSRLSSVWPGVRRGPGETLWYLTRMSWPIFAPLTSRYSCLVISLSSQNVSDLDVPPRFVEISAIPEIILTCPVSAHAYLPSDLPACPASSFRGKTYCSVKAIVLTWHWTSQYYLCEMSGVDTDSYPYPAVLQSLVSSGSCKAQLACQIWLWRKLKLSIHRDETGRA